MNKMATEFVPYSPVGGINSELPSGSIQDSQVQDARNFLFSRGRALTRGGVVEKDAAKSSTIGPFVFAQHLTSPQTGGLYFFAKDASSVGTIWRFSSPATYTQITPSGGNMTGSPASPGIVINANMMWPLGPSYDMIRITTGATYELIGCKASFIVGHGARCLAAYVETYPNRVAWSVIGDESDWTTVPGSGHTDLSDSSSWITGLGLINEVVIVCRADGFHFGYPTGTVAMPYRFENRSKKGIGALWGITFYDDLLFFANTQDVFLLTKDGLKAIGGGMRHEIIREINNSRTGNNGVQYQGLVTERLSGELGPWYHLAPAFPPTAPSSVDRWWRYTRRAPHFAYNLREDRWQKFFYPGVFGGVFSTYSEDLNLEELGVGGEGRHQWYYPSSALPVEEEAFFLGKTLSLGGPTKDMRLRRMLLRYKDTGAGEVRVGCEADLNDTRWGVEEKVAIGGLCTGKWKRKWVNLEVSGNDFEYKVTVPPGNQLETDLIGGMYEPASDYQGT